MAKNTNDMKEVNYEKIGVYFSITKLYERIAKIEVKIEILSQKK